MKKTLLYVLMSFALLGLLTGFAGTRAAAASDSEKKEYTFADMTYQIPVEWEEGSNSNEMNQYYYSTTSMIMVNAGSSTTGKTELSEADRSLYLKVLEQSFDKFEVLDQDTYIVGPYTGFSFKANISTNGTDTLMYAIVFDNGEKMKAMTINSYDGADDSAILDDIASSIVFPGVETTSTEQKSTGTTTESKKSTGGPYGTDSIEEFNKDTALERAKFHTKYNSYSEKGLVKMLVFEGFSDEDAEYGAHNCGADWNEECAEDAQKYLNYKSFTRDELYQQLKYEGYTESEILYGLAEVGL